jgi:hypothetical protein
MSQGYHGETTTSFQTFLSTLYTANPLPTNGHQANC